jgi:hypothetical protein
MLRRRSHREAHRETQRRYEARLRDGVGLYPVPLTAFEIDLLIALGWLPEGHERNRDRVGQAVAAAIRELGRAIINGEGSWPDRLWRRSASSPKRGTPSADY